MANVEENSRLGGFVTKFEVLNNSPSKFNYSFPKQRRFKSVAKKLNESIGYDLPSTLVKRTCGFGIGERFQSLNKSSTQKSSKCRLTASNSFVRLSTTWIV